jgi:hypothetical protein
MVQAVTARQKLDCAERELRIRKQVYLNKVMTGRLTQAKADYEIEVMAAIAEDYRKQVPDLVGMIGCGVPGDGEDEQEQA